MKKVAVILVNYKDYARRFLAECRDGLRAQDYPKDLIKIYITDNESDEESQKFLRENYPEAELIINKNNDGFAKGNNDAIKIAIGQRYDYVVLFNLDTIIDPRCIGEMIGTAERDEKIGAVQARLMLWPEKDKVNSLGNDIHFLGFGYCRGYRSQVESADEISYPSGAAVLFKCEVLEKVGLFDEEFWMYNEDEDIGWRIWLAGYKCVLANNAIVFHKYEFSRSITKYYWMDRNRILCILKNYHFSTICLIFPAFIIMELGLLMFSFKNGWFKEKLGVYRYFLSIKTLKYVLKERKKIQSSRQVDEKDIVGRFSGNIWYQEVDDIKLRLVNPIFDFYWRVAKKIIIW